MTPEYSVLYKRIGIRRIQQFVSPSSFNADMLVLPKSSTIHFISPDPDVRFPAVDDPLFHNFNKKIQIIAVGELASQEGGVRHLNKMLKVLYRDWAIKHNDRFRVSTTDIPEPNDPLSLNVYNYCLLEDMYKYSQMAISGYYKWLNTHKTIWYNVNKSAKETRRNQFVFVDLPTILPSPSVLNQFAHKVSPQILKVFDTDERINVLDFWKWLDQTAHPDSTISMVEKDQLPLVNIVFRYKDRICLLNLDVVSKWSTESEHPDPGAPVLKPVQLQRFALKFLLTFQSQQAVETGEDVLEAEAATIDQELHNPIAKIDEGIVENKLNEVYSQDAIADTTKSLDEELKALDDLNTSLYDKDEEVTDVPNFEHKEEEVQEIHAAIHAKPHPNDALKAKIDTLAEDSVLTAADYRALLKQYENSKNAKSPYDKSQTLDQHAVIKPEELKLPPEKTTVADMSNVHDKTMLQSSLLTFDSHYTKNVLSKDISGVVTSIKNAGFIVKEHVIEEEDSAMGQYEFHTLSIKPIRGADSTLHFRLPKVSEEGEFTVSGNKYRMRKQRGDVPIRKIDSGNVALSSYYGKAFVMRCERKAFDDMDWLCNNIMQVGISGGNDTIKKIAPANVYDNKFKAPVVYGALSKRFKTITTTSYTLVFDHLDIPAIADESTVKAFEKMGQVVCGFTKGTDILTMGMNNKISIWKNKTLTELGTIYDVLMIDATKSPNGFSELKVFSKSIPLGVVMGYFIGLSKLIKLMRVKPVILETGKRYTLGMYDWVLQFKDYKLIFNKNDQLATLMLSGFNFFKDSLKQYDFHAFDDKNVYLNILDQRDITGRYLKELDMMNNMFVDPITQGILEEMKEPTTFQGLLLRSNEMLLDSWHPDSSDMAYMRIRGYERISGMLYHELVASLRDFNARSIQNKSQVSMNPYAVWNAITQDQTVKLSEDINPINDIKETEAITYVGSDGRSKDAINGEARQYHVNDMGVISEATVDSSEVAINTYSTANPNFINVRGITDRFTESKGAAGLLSTSVLLNAGSTKDDPKRVNFLSIQNSHSVACSSYHQPHVRTGYEYVMPFRGGKMYAYMATGDGIVTSLTDKVIEVEYTKTKERVAVKIGNQIGKAEGSFYTHPVVTTLKAGQKFKQNDAIAYNNNFYEPDILDPNRLIFKNTTVFKTAIMESTQTFEDSCGVSKKMSGAMNTTITKEKTFVIKFEQNIRNILPEGTEVKFKDLLFIVEDPITSHADVFDSDTIETLTRLSNLAPKAKINGKIEKYVVYYNGEVEDMSPSLRKFVTECDKKLDARTKLTDQHIKNGRVNEEYRVDGKSLQVDTMVIKVYLTMNDNVGIGDKLTSIQLKSVVSEVFDYPMRTEANEDIDYVFGFKSISNRIVSSPQVIGTTTTLLKVIAKKAVELYKS